MTTMPTPQKAKPVKGGHLPLFLMPELVREPEPLPLPTLPAGETPQQKIAALGGSRSSRARRTKEYTAMLSAASEPASPRRSLASPRKSQLSSLVSPLDDAGALASTLHRLAVGSPPAAPPRSPTLDRRATGLAREQIESAAAAAAGSDVCTYVLGAEHLPLSQRQALLAPPPQSIAAAAAAAAAGHAAPEALFASLLHFVPQLTPVARAHDGALALLAACAAAQQAVGATDSCVLLCRAPPPTADGGATAARQSR